MNQLTIQALLNLITGGENETAEFKESFNDEALETIGAFANARGGMILIGIKDKGEICGVQMGKKTLEDIANRIQDATDPRLQPSISSVCYKDKFIIVIHVVTVTVSPVSVRGRYFRRTGKTNQRMSHEEIMHRIMAATGMSWDMGTEPNTQLSDLDPEKINRFIQTLKKTGRQPIPEQASDEEILRKLEYITDNKPTRAAVLLFGLNPDRYFLSAFLKAGRFRSPTLIVDDREFHGTLIDQLDGITGWFRERLQTEFIITGKAARDVRWEYPLKAIREAITNVLCHRDYTSNAHTQIRLYDNHLEIRNPGSLPPSLTTEDLFHVHDSIPRNRKIAEAFFLTGIIERWGSGTLSIAEELHTAGFPEPQFESKTGHFQVTFYKPTYTVSQDLKKIGLSERQLKAIDYVNQHGSINNTEYQNIGKVSKSTATRELNQLKIKGILYAEGTTGRGTIYRLKGS